MVVVVGLSWNQRRSVAGIKVLSGPVWGGKPSVRGNGISGLFTFVRSTSKVLWSTWDSKVARPRSTFVQLIPLLPATIDCVPLLRLSPYLLA
jgi:hypothetical protein